MNIKSRIAPFEKNNFNPSDTPVLLCLKDNSNVIVYMTSIRNSNIGEEYIGTGVVLSGNSEQPAGSDSNGWKISKFEPYYGDVTITQTE